MISTRTTSKLDFAVRYFKGVVKELGVEIEYRQDLSVPVCVPQRVYAASRFGDRLALVSSAPKAQPALGSVARLRSAARRLVPRR